MTDFIACSKCRDKQGPAPGYYYIMLNGYLTAQECTCHRKWAEESRVEKSCIQAGVSTTLTFKDYAGTESKSSVLALSTFCRNFNKYKTKTNVFLYGTNGTQKTTMAQVLGKELIKQGYSVKYVLMENLIQDLNNNFSQDIAQEQRLHDYKYADCLIIDEAFDPTKVTIYKSGYQLPYLDSFLRNRYDIDMKSTVFISNVRPEDISVEKFGKSLQNFVYRTTYNSFLEFKDEYIKQPGIGVPKPNASLFKIRRSL